jgi:chromatin segregation and condensation protein Rec8/ScpA/Scc1 (kleisin family)
MFKIYSENYLRDNIIDNKEKISKTFYNLLLTSQENNIDIIQEIFFGKIIKN